MQYSEQTARCTCTPVVGTRFGGATGRRPSEAIVEAVAAAEGVGPLELPPLYDDIDMESINKLFSTTQQTMRSPPLLEFSVLGWNVYVRGDGAIRVCDPAQVTDPEPVFEKAICD